ncbi:MAG: sigma-70 family RNA polymerase sigma factor [Chitinophagales bacterium]
MQNNVERLWFRFGKHLSEFICRKTGRIDQCHDVLHDVYVKIDQNISLIEKADNVGAYLTRLAGNAVNDFYRRNSISIDLDQEESPVFYNPKEEYPLADCCLREMIESLPAIYRDALIKTELEGLSQKEFAELSGISYTGARSRVQRARQKLKEAILACCKYEFDRYGNIVSCINNPKTGCCK